MELTALKARLEALGYRASVFESTEAACDYMEKAVGGRTRSAAAAVQVSPLGPIRPFPKGNGLLLYVKQLELTASFSRLFNIF